MTSTPEERLARLEARQDGQDAWLQSIDAKVDQLLAAANMGKGAWKTIMWIGGILTTVVAAGAWLLDKLSPLFGKH